MRVKITNIQLSESIRVDLSDIPESFPCRDENLREEVDVYALIEWGYTDGIKWEEI